MNLSFCESMCAWPGSPWHIRVLTNKGRKLGGGIDTGSLCGLVKMGGDLDVDINEYHLNNNTCQGCLTKYRKMERQK